MTPPSKPLSNVPKPLPPARTCAFSTDTPPEERQGGREGEREGRREGVREGGGREGGRRGREGGKERRSRGMEKYK